MRPDERRNTDVMERLALLALLILALLMIAGYGPTLT
jgi:hypothetical protein